MWFNFFPYIHRRESEAESQAKLSVLFFAIENKKCTEKRSSEYLYCSSRYFRSWKLFGIPYKEKSLKVSTRETRGADQKREVTSETDLSSKWKMFLQDTTNKEELFSLLTKKVKDFQSPENKDVNITSGENVFLSSGSSGCEDATTRKLRTQELLCMFYTLSIRTQSGS